MQKMRCLCDTFPLRPNPVKEADQDNIRRLQRLSTALKRLNREEIRAFLQWSALP
jgi:hypothetical protein